MKIIFFGDSITDACRDRQSPTSLGEGYAHLAAARLGFDEMGKYEFINMGIGGNRSIDLLARLRADVIAKEPDVVSILIGVNDVWHEYEIHNGVSTELYTLYLRQVLLQLKEALPKVRVMLLEPFVLSGPAVERYFPSFRAEVVERARAAEALAKEYNIPFIYLQDKFDSLAEKAGSRIFSADGVHPTHAGHELIAREWLSAFKRM